MQEMNDLKDEFQREREMMSDQVHELTIQLKAKCTVINWFIPESEVNKIEQRMKWSD